MRMFVNSFFLGVLLLAMLPDRLGAQAISRYVRSSGPEARITVRAAERAPFAVPRTVYGTFLENIGFSIFGGVSAQLLDNPSLESYYASLETLEQRFSAPPFRRSTQRGLPLPWLPLRWEDGWRYEPRQGQAANSVSFLYLMGLAGREVGIRQSVFLPIHRERAYTGSLFASSQGPAELEVSFRKQDSPADVLVASRVKVPGGGRWAKLPFRLVLPENAVAPFQPVDFVVALRDDRRISLDLIRLYPTDAVQGLDPEVIKAAAVLNSPLLRYGGNFTSGYHWRDGVGPLERSPTRLNQAWGYPEYNEFGTDEFMAFCRLIGARPQICLNLGSGTPGEARAWVEYCQGSPATPAGTLRAARASRQPYPVAAWELGNELWGDFQIGWQTAEGHPHRYHEFYRAIRGLVPPETLILATGGDIDFFEKWNAALLDKYPHELHYLTTHFVAGMGEMQKEDAEQDFKLAADFALPVGVARALEAVRAQIDSHPRTRGRVKLAYTEWLFWAPEGSALPRFDNLGGAIIAAGWMNMLLTHADFVPIANMTGLIEFGGIQKKRGRVFLTPQYWAFSLYSNHAGNTPVATRTEVPHYDVHAGQRRVPEIPAVPYLDVLATVDTRRRDLALFVVNRDWKGAIPATIQLQDFTPSPEAKVLTLAADSILVRNDDEHPDTVRPVATTLELPDSSFRYTFPPASLTVLIFQPR